MASICSKRKPLSLCVATILVLALLAGCGQRSKQSTGTIRPMELTNDQQELLDMVSISNREIHLFSYELPPGIAKVDLEVVVYEGGSGLTISKLVTDLEDTTGNLVVLSDNRTPGWAWVLAAGDGTIASGQTQPPFDGLPRSLTLMEESTEIVPDEPVILYAAGFSRGVMSAYDTISYQAQPELLQQYEYAHVIQCTFLSEETADDQ